MIADEELVGGGGRDWAVLRGERGVEGREDGGGVGHGGGGENSSCYGCCLERPELKSEVGVSSLLSRNQ